MPAGPSGLIVLPHFATTGPPEFIGNSRGVVLGLTLETNRGTIAKGILEGATYYIRQCLDDLPASGIHIDSFQAVGGGSQSDAWVQLSADILGRPLARPHVTEAGTLGAAILAGVGVGTFASVQAGVEAMVHTERVFEPRAREQGLYSTWFLRYTELWPLLAEYLRRLSAAQGTLAD
jgi:sugar (pentulose or hexulose) kinase